MPTRIDLLKAGANKSADKLADAIVNKFGNDPATLIRIVKAYLILNKTLFTHCEVVGENELLFLAELLVENVKDFVATRSYIAKEG